MQRGVLTNTRLFLLTGALLAASIVPADDAAFPSYKPSSRAAPMDIRTNAYGASHSAPDALKIDDVAPAFTLPLAQGGKVSLSEVAPAAIVFYRGHW
jgi:hypothetical protein